MAGKGVLDILTLWAARVALLGTSGLCLVAFAPKSPALPLSTAAFRYTHILAFSSWFGSTIWISFIHGVVLLRAVDRTTFTKVQVTIFDAFFRFSALCLAGGLASHGGAGLSDTSVWKSSLTPALGCVLVNLLHLGPQTTTVLLERLKLCKELGVETTDRSNPKVRDLSKKFGKYHGMSNLLNLAATFCGLFHAWALSTAWSVA